MSMKHVDVLVIGAGPAGLAAAQAARFTGEAANPTPATAVAELMPFIGEGIRRTT